MTTENIEPSGKTDEAIPAFPAGERLNISLIGTEVKSFEKP